MCGLVSGWGQDGSGGVVAIERLLLQFRFRSH